MASHTENFELANKSNFKENFIFLKHRVIREKAREKEAIAQINLRYLCSVPGQAGVILAPQNCERAELLLPIIKKNNMSRNACVVSLMKPLYSCECCILPEQGECAAARSFHSCLLDSTQKSGSG